MGIVPSIMLWASSVYTLLLSEVKKKGKKKMIKPSSQNPESAHAPK